MFAPIQGACDKEAKEMENLKMLTLWVSAKIAPTRADLQATPSAAITHSAVNGILRKFGVTNSPVQSLHQCKVHIKRKLRG